LTPIPNPEIPTLDFELVLKTLIAEFSRLKIRCAAIGGFALDVLGCTEEAKRLRERFCRAE
jgi:hypothetical protein